MMPSFRPACLALVFVATAVPACAQNWVYEPDTPAGQTYAPGAAYVPPATVPAYSAPAYTTPDYAAPAYAAPAYVPDRRAVVDEQPLALTPAQRTTIYRTIIPQGHGRGPIVRERIVTEMVPAPLARERVLAGPVGVDYADYALGSRVADSYALAPLPRAVVEAVPAVRPYRYMVINRRLLLVDPATGIVVAEVAR